MKKKYIRGPKGSGSHLSISTFSQPALSLVPFRQRAGYCGPASLKMIFNYYKKNIEESKIVNLLGLSSAIIRNRGVSSERLVEAAEKLGFHGFIKDYSTLEDIRKYVVQHKIPVIVDWFMDDEGHYSVVSGIDEDNIYLVDPSLGQVRALRLPTFNRVWFDFSEAYLKSKKDLVLRRMIVISKKKLA